MDKVRIVIPIKKEEDIWTYSLDEITITFKSSVPLKLSKIIWAMECCKFDVLSLEEK